MSRHFTCLLEKISLEAEEELKTVVDDTLLDIRRRRGENCESIERFPINDPIQSAGSCSFSSQLRSIVKRIVSLLLSLTGLCCCPWLAAVD